MLVKRVVEIEQEIEIESRKGWVDYDCLNAIVSLFKHRFSCPYSELKAPCTVRSDKGCLWLLYAESTELTSEDFNFWEPLWKSVDFEGHVAFYVGDNEIIDYES